MLGQLETFIAFAVVILGVSLMITVLNQMVIAFLGLRGTNLRWGLETLLEQVDGRLATSARDISNHILQHPLISDSTCSKVRTWPIVGGIVSRWRLASAITVGELVNIMRLLAEPIPAGQSASTWRQGLTNTLADRDAQAAKRFSEAAQAVALLSPGSVQKLDEHVASRVRGAVGDVELWFDSIMDRVAQRFAAHTRASTVVFALLIAFALHLDASVLLEQIRSDPQLRANLVASSDAMTKHADRVLGASVTSIYRLAGQRLQGEAPELKTAGDVPALLSESDGLAWVSRQVPDPGRRSELNARYEALVQEELKKLMGELGSEATAIRKSLETAGFRLIPDYGVHTRKDNWPDWLPSSDGDGNKHFFGVLAAAALLSLGAPFWFNALKSAANLRPILATKEEETRAPRA
jgi:hypothetical protein